MNVATRILISVLFLAAASTAWAEKPASAKSAPAEQVTTGVFTGIEQGDYFYLKLRTQSGQEESFMILDDSHGLKAFVDKPKKHLGKKIRLRWIEKEENLPEAGGPVQVHLAIGVEKLQ